MFSLLVGQGTAPGTKNSPLNAAGLREPVESADCLGDEVQESSANLLPVLPLLVKVLLQTQKYIRPLKKPVS